MTVDIARLKELYEKSCGRNLESPDCKDEWYAPVEVLDSLHMIHDALPDVLRELESRQWVDCEERLPELYTPVLVCVRTLVRERKVMYLSDTWEPARWDDGENVFPQRIVSHWMPLPELPETKE